VCETEKNVLLHNLTEVDLIFVTEYRLVLKSETSTYDIVMHTGPGIVIVRLTVSEND
jgi:hypothetical protein